MATVLVVGLSRRLQSYMGHKHYTTTQRYLHHKPQPQDAARLHQAFGGKPTMPPVEQPQEAADA